MRKDFATRNTPHRGRSRSPRQTQPRDRRRSSGSRSLGRRDRSRSPARRERNRSPARRDRGADWRSDRSRSPVRRCRGPRSPSHSPPTSPQGQPQSPPDSPPRLRCSWAGPSRGGGWGDVGLNRHKADGGGWGLLDELRTGGTEAFQGAESTRSQSTTIGTNRQQGLAYLVPIYPLTSPSITPSSLWALLPCPLSLPPAPGPPRPRMACKRPQLHAPPDQHARS